MSPPWNFHQNFYIDPHGISNILNRGYTIFFLEKPIKKKINDNEYIADHLERTLKSNNIQWRYPVQDDTSNVYAEQIINLKIEGTWDMTQTARNMKFVLGNAKENKLQHF